jgi:rare lipoprotein A
MARARFLIRWLLPGLCAGMAVLPLAAQAGTPPAADSIHLSPSTVLLGQITVVRGALGRSEAGAPVSLELQRGSGAWTTVAQRVAGPSGGFAIGWRAHTPGRLTLRVVAGAASSASAGGEVPTAVLSVYDSVRASWYGPGLYGRHTACGEVLTPELLGVAHRSLPCGTPVSISYHGHTIVVPVIDRGPYSDGAMLDLTHATAEELGITETVNVGALALTGSTMTPGNWWGPSGSTGSTGVDVGGAIAPTS